MADEINTDQLLNNKVLLIRRSQVLELASLLTQLLHFYSISASSQVSVDSLCHPDTMVSFEMLFGVISCYMAVINYITKS